MKYDADIPIYVQIIEKIKNDILNGILVPGEKLPSIQDMAVTMEVNQNTISRAYKDCESLGIIETKRGIGSFVIENQALINQLRTEKVRLIIQAFIHDLEALGYSRDQIIDLVKNTSHIQLPVAESAKEFTR
ncbi:GntR family transcriptional regulator [Treponema vincentii]|uniref:GntR family transcriptional regulator n=1 Tax=Treponema vincentii TaxID=69710 RepID=UPI0035F59ABE